MNTFSHNGLELAFLDHPPVDAGAHATPVLLIHGFASSIRVNWIGPLWVKTLTEAGYRVIAIENRGHGASDKRHDPQDYATPRMAEDGLALLDHLSIARAFVMGYSMGARISAFLTLAHPERVIGLALGGLGIHLVDGVGLPIGIADGLEEPDKSKVTDPMARMFRLFAEANGGDLAALAACIRGSRQTLSREEVARMSLPVLVSVGTNDPVAGSGSALAALFAQGEYFAIEGRDHNLAVGDKTHRAAVLAFFERLRTLEP